MLKSSLLVAVTLLVLIFAGTSFCGDRNDRTSRVYILISRIRHNGNAAQIPKIVQK